MADVLVALADRDWSIVVEAWKDFNVSVSRDEWVFYNDASNDRSQRLTDGKLWKSWLKYDKANKPFNGDTQLQLTFANDLFIMLNQG